MSWLASIKEIIQPYLVGVDQTFNHFEPLVNLSARIRVRPAYILIVFFLIAVITLGTGIFSHLFVALFGLIYPSYMTFKALSSGNSQNTKEWLTYWIVFGFFTAFARTARFLFFFLSLKSYNVFRIILYLYLFHPRTNGAAYIYNNFLKKKLQDIQQFLDNKGKSSA